MACPLQERGISPESLYKLMNDYSSTHTVLIDTRPFSDYAVGHLANAKSVKLSSMLLRRLHLKKIQLKDIFNEHDRESFVQSCSSSSDFVVVVYDADTKMNGNVIYDQKNPLHVILKALQDNNVPCFYLEGNGDDLFYIPLTRTSHFPFSHEFILVLSCNIFIFLVFMNFLIMFSLLNFISH